MPLIAIAVAAVLAASSGQNTNVAPDGSEEGGALPNLDMVTHYHNGTHNNGEIERPPSPIPSLHSAPPPTVTFQRMRGPGSAAAAAAAAHGTPAIVLPGGGLELRLDSVAVTVVSTFSSQALPSGAIINAFNRSAPAPSPSGWTVAVLPPLDGQLGRVLGTCPLYRVSRVYFRGSDGGVYVNDTITAHAVAGVPLVGVQQRHYATVNPLAATITNVVGPAEEIDSCATSGLTGTPHDEGDYGPILGFASGTSGNPSIHATIQPLDPTDNTEEHGEGRTETGALATVGVALMALDDVSMIHAEVANHATAPCNTSTAFAMPWAPAVQLADPHFALDPGASHTQEWVIYGLSPGCASYWCFINLARESHGATDVEIPGNGPLNGFELPLLAASGNNRSGPFTSWGPNTTRQVMGESGATYIITGIPWMDEPSVCEPGNSRYAHGSAFVHNLAPSCEVYIKDLVRVVKAANPDWKVLVYFHAFLSGEPNASSTYAADRLLRGNGTQQCYGGCCEEWPMFYPASLGPDNIPNAYAKQLDLYLDRVFALGADGIYHDESSWSVSPYTWINDPARWDGVSAAFNSSLYPTKVSSLTLLRQPHHLALLKRAATRGATTISNAMPTTRTYLRVRPAPAIHFVETGQEIRGHHTHLYTPLMLNRELDQSADKDPVYNDTVGDAPGLNFLAHLDSGTLSQLCSRLVQNGTHNSVYTKMTPITPVELGPGFVLGTTKLVTKVNATVCWICDGTDKLRVSRYNKTGAEVSAESVQGNATVLVPPEHAAIVEVVG